MPRFWRYARTKTKHTCTPDQYGTCTADDRDWCRRCGRCTVWTGEICAECGAEWGAEDIEREVAEAEERGWNAAVDAVASARVRTLDASLLDALAALRKDTGREVDATWL